MSMTVDSYEYWKGTTSRVRERHGEDDFPFLLPEGEREMYDAPYGHVFTGSLNADAEPGNEAQLQALMDDIFMRHNASDRPLGKIVGAMSPGDVIVLNLRVGNEWNGSYKKRAFVVRRIGFKEVDADKFDGQSKYLAGPTRLGSGRHLIAYQRELQDRTP